MASQLRQSLVVGFGGIQAIDTEFRIGFLSSTGGRLPHPCSPPSFLILREHEGPRPSLVLATWGRVHSGFRQFLAGI